jgi:hypothetical protein
LRYFLAELKAFVCYFHECQIMMTLTMIVIMRYCIIVHSLFESKRIFTIS